MLVRIICFLALILYAAILPSALAEYDYSSGTYNPGYSSTYSGINTAAYNNANSYTNNFAIYLPPVILQPPDTDFQFDIPYANPTTASIIREMQITDAVKNVNNLLNTPNYGFNIPQGQTADAGGNVSILKSLPAQGYADTLPSGYPQDYEPPKY
jgi:hypothetical protein